MEQKTNFLHIVSTVWRTILLIFAVIVLTGGMLQLLGFFESSLSGSLFFLFGGASLFFSLALVASFVWFMDKKFGPSRKISNSVVLAVVVILVFSILSARFDTPRKSPDGRRISDIKQLQLANELYFGEKGSYPQTLEMLVPDFISLSPFDPKSKKPYHYSVHESGLGYHLGATLDEYHSILNTDSDCNSITGYNCPFDGGYNQTTAFDGADDKGCGGEKGKYCFDVLEVR